VDRGLDGVQQAAQHLLDALQFWVERHLIFGEGIVKTSVYII
jgi:hypothetical protein